MQTINSHSSVIFGQRYPIPKREMERQTFAPFLVCENDEVSSTSLSLMKKKYSGEQTETYKRVAEDSGLAITTVYRRIHGARNAFVPPQDFIDGFAERFGIEDKEKITKAVSKSPVLVTVGLDKIEENANEMTRLFEPAGMTRSGIINSYLKQPSLIYTLPQTAHKNFYSIINEFPQIESKVLLKNYLNNPSMFYQAPATIKKHLKIVNFILKNKKNTQMDMYDIAAGKTLTYSSEQYYLRLLNRLMFKSLGENKLKESNLKENLREYLLEHERLRYEFSVVKDECAGEFVEFVKNFSKNTLGRNVFNIKILK